MFNQVKDAIICFDDFERMSNKLDIKDVMGLANYLKLEKNCQIILILDEDKAEGDNKQKYADYKEKLVDETIIINSVEPLIRENTKDIDDQLVDLMVDFANKLEIHNFRFFQKVIKLYQQFRKELPEEVADSTKEIILIRILQGYLIQDFRQLE
jgi:regulator of PEP synthase PpsR (kinase-PPPase family)